MPSTAAPNSPAARVIRRLLPSLISTESSRMFRSIADRVIEGLERTASYHHLSEWQPDICAELYAALYQVHRTQNAAYGMDVPLELRAKETAAFERLCELDSSAALKLLMEIPPM